MGQSLSYQAIPEESRLFARLRSDLKVATLVTGFFNCGGGAYTWASLDDLDESLRGIAEVWPQTFASRGEVDRAMADLVADLEEARAMHPGLERRRAFLEKTQGDIEERLIPELKSRGWPAPDRFASAIVFGDEVLTPPGVRGPLGSGLRVVRSSEVAETARALRDLVPGSLFDAEEEDWLYDDFRSWREMYLAAAENGEAVLIGD